MTEIPSGPACAHCEAEPAVTPLGLCARCGAVKRVHLLYVPKARHAADDPRFRHRRRKEDILRWRASRRLPLFPRINRGRVHNG
jgi:hypothetical protein